MDRQLAHDLMSNGSSARSQTETVRSLIERYRRSHRFERAEAASCPIRSVGVVGAGIMGTAIAAVHVKRHMPVVITDVAQPMLDQARERVVAELVGEESEPEMPIEEARQLVELFVHPTTKETLLDQCDLIVESIPETLSAKRLLYARLEPQLRDGAVLASNTSTIPIAELSEELAHPDRFCGLHFFHPVRRRPLVEIIRGPNTTAETIARATAHATAIGKVPIVVDDGPGFLVNRLLIPYLSEAMELLLEGAAIPAIEKAATDFGMAKGPLRLLDEIGLDTVLQGGWVLAKAFPERIGSSPLLVSMIKAGRTGRKSGAGFFCYGREGVEDDTAKSSETVERIISKWAGPPGSHTPQAIVHRLLLPMILEATRMIEAGTIRDPNDIDLGAVLGLGFPASVGGPLQWADTLSPARIVDLLRPLAHLGPRMQPTGLLREMARAGSRFYPQEGSPCLGDSIPGS